jgi:hypothetical protein
MDLRPRQEDSEKPQRPKGLRASKTSFKKGQPNPGKGRPRGTHNKIPLLLKECIIAAAEIHGRNGKGKDGLTGFLLNLAVKDLRAFAMLLARVLPLQIDHKKEVKVEVTYRSVEEIQEELRQRGIRLDLLARAIYDKPNRPNKMIDVEGRNVEVESEREK